MIVEMRAEVMGVVLLFPMVLAVHNAEECVRVDEFLTVYRSRLPVSLRKPSVVLIANVMLTAAAMLLSALNWLLPSHRLLYWMYVSICALLLNAVSHGVLSMKRGEMIPGTWSAVIIVLPYSVAALIAMQICLGYSLRTVIEMGLIGAIAGPTVIFLFLWLGYFLIRLRGVLPV